MNAMRTTLRTTAAALLILAAGACDNPFGGAGGVALQRNQLAIAKEIWAGHALADYSYRLDVSCTCLPTPFPDSLRVMVSGGESTLSYYAEPDDAAPSVFDQFGSVERLFTIVEEAIEAPVYDRLISYSQEYGFPSRIRVHRTDGRRVDLMVSEFDEAAP